MVQNTNYTYGKKFSKGTRIARELDAIQRSDPDNALKAPNIVAWAKAHPRSTLHKQFPWNDSKAAHMYRLDVARHIIRAYVEIVHEDYPPVRAMISLPSDRGDGKSGYRSTEDILKNTEWRTEMLGMAKRDMRLFKAKYHILKELAGVFKAMDSLLQ